jgi:transcriptional regulator with XRE-family HTH domain
MAVTIVGNLGGAVQLTGGQRLRGLRDALGYTMREVENGSLQVARRLANDEFSIPPSRLSDIETKGVVPSIFRLYTLAAIYRSDYRELLSWYGIDLNSIAADVVLTQPHRSHLIHTSGSAAEAKVPVRLDPGFSLSKTTNMGRMIEKWGVVPLTYLSTLADDRYSYGYIGTEDFTMYPILPPGSFVQVDETKNRVTEGVWRSEIERPIYFVETREGFVCSWCNLSRDRIVLQSHPLSPVQVRSLKHPQEAEVIGQVVGAAIRLGDWKVLYSEPEQKECAELT